MRGRGVAAGYSLSGGETSALGWGDPRGGPSCPLDLAEPHLVPGRVHSIPQALVGAPGPTQGTAMLQATDDSLPWEGPKAQARGDDGDW